MRTHFTILALSILLWGPPAACGQTIAIVVNRSNPRSDISWAELVKVMKMEKQSWEGGRPIVLATRTSDSEPFQKVLPAVYSMSEAQLKRFWVERVFRGEVPVPPVAYDTDEKLLKAIASDAGAIGYVDVAAVNESVKVLRVDGMAPENPTYRLR